MRSLAAQELSASVGRVVDARTFVWIEAVEREAPFGSQGFGFWTDGGAFTCDVVDALTGGTVERTFRGGAIIEVREIALTSDMAVRTTDIRLSAIDANVEAMVRTYDVRGAPVQIYRAFFDPETREIVAPAKPRFVGFIDGAPIATGKEGDASVVTLACASHTREFTRKNAAVRSHESQIQRSATDDFYKDTASAGEWDIAWGEVRKNAGGARGNTFGRDVLS
ncbi:MAG: hypothetical protein ACK4NE_00135 [Albidovulum sp.]